MFAWKVLCVTCSVSIHKKRLQEQMEQSEATKTLVGHNQHWLRCHRLAPVTVWCNKQFPLHSKPQTLYISTSSFRQLPVPVPYIWTPLHCSVIWMSRTTIGALSLQGFYTMALCGAGERAVVSLWNTARSIPTQQSTFPCQFWYIRWWLWVVLQCLMFCEDGPFIFFIGPLSQVFSPHQQKNCVHTFVK